MQGCNESFRQGSSITCAIKHQVFTVLEILSCICCSCSGSVWSILFLQFVPTQQKYVFFSAHFGIFFPPTASIFLRKFAKDFVMQRKYAALSIIKCAIVRLRYLVEAVAFFQLISFISVFSIVLKLCLLALAEVVFFFLL